MRKQSHAEIAAERAEENAAYSREINTLIEQIEKLFHDELPNAKCLSSQEFCSALYDMAVFVQSMRTFRINRGQPGNCSPRAGSYAAVGSGVPWSVSLIARRIGIPRRRAVSMTDRTLA